MIRCGLICSSWWLKKVMGESCWVGKAKYYLKLFSQATHKYPSLFFFSFHLFFAPFLSFLPIIFFSLSVHILFLPLDLITSSLYFALLFLLYFLFWFSFLPIFLYIFHLFLSSLLIWLPFLLTVFFYTSFSLICFSLSFSLSDSFLTFLTSQHQYVYQFASRRHQESRLILTIIKESQ